MGSFEETNTWKREVKEESDSYLMGTLMQNYLLPSLRNSQQTQHTYTVHHGDLFTIPIFVLLNKTLKMPMRSETQILITILRYTMPKNTTYNVLLEKRDSSFVLCGGEARLGRESGR